MNSSPQQNYPAPTSSDDRSVAVITHLAAPIAMVLSAGWLNFVGPLLVWLVYKDKSPMVRQAAAGAFNFAVSTTVLGWIAWVFFITLIGIPIAVALWIIVVVATIWCSIKGAMRASSNTPYTYPMQFIKLLS